ncbi:MAG: hypothetical protein JXQ76_08155 [Campylobacterales bacterium]|nr:hypothetical protein [Campylobacterales bacterium]
MTNKKLSISYLIIKYSLLVLLMLSVYGIWSDFLPNIELFNSTQLLSLLLAIILIVVFYIEFTSHTSIIKQNIKGKQNPWFIAITLPILLSILAYIGMTLGLPALMHEVSLSSNGDESFSVKSKSSTYHNSRCMGGVTIKYPNFLKEQICGIPQDFWHDISKGDRLILMGEKSEFGLKYDRVKYIKKP